MTKVYRVYIAQQSLTDIGSWLKQANIEGATITPGFGYWDGVMEPQHTIELCNADSTDVQALLALVFEHTSEQAVLLTRHEIHYAQEMHRTPYDTDREHKAKKKATYDSIARSILS